MHVKDLVRVIENLIVYCSYYYIPFFGASEFPSVL